MTPRVETVDSELAPLLDDVFQSYHHDFRNYAPASLARRVKHAMLALGCSTPATLRVRLQRDPGAFPLFLEHMTVQVSDMFRTPSYWLALRERVLPHLSTYPFLRIWVAGCGAGEEAYSMAILCHEEGLLHRTQIYATDIIASKLRAAAAGSYDLSRFRSFTSNYFASGGRASLSDYYTTSVHSGVFSPELKSRILFCDHSLATDSAFAEVQLISCRNVLIYFNSSLQNRAIALFADALSARGFMGLGDKETPMFSSSAKVFEAFARDQKIYRKCMQHDATRK